MNNGSSSSSSCMHALSNLAPLQLMYNGAGQQGGEQLLRLLLLALVVGHALVVNLGVLEHGSGGVQRDVDHHRHEERQRDEDGERHRLFALEHVQLLRHKLLDRHRKSVHDGLRARKVLEQVTEMFRLSFAKEVYMKHVGRLLFPADILDLDCKSAKFRESRTGPERARILFSCNISLERR